MENAFLRSCFIENLVEAKPFDIILLVSYSKENSQFALYSQV
jgi:hypothetical protein